MFEDALVFSFVKLVGKSLEHESNMLFLTGDMDFDVEKVLKEMSEVGVEVYSNSGECMQRVKASLAYDLGIGAFVEVRIVLLCHITGKSTAGGGMTSNHLENKTNIKRLNGWLI